MVELDLVEFATMLDSVCTLLSKGQYVPNDDSTAIFFRALERYPMLSVRAAFVAHVRVSRFPPTPADILDLLHNDTRPGTEEAWANVVRTLGGEVGVPWTAEMVEAWGLSSALAQSDMVGARMAFREAYARLVAVARNEQRRVDWSSAPVDLRRVVGGVLRQEALTYFASMDQRRSEATKPPRALLARRLATSSAREGGANGQGE